MFFDIGIGLEQQLEFDGLLLCVPVAGSEVEGRWCYDITLNKYGNQWSSQYV